jgi:hypothetical protein
MDSSFFWGHPVGKNIVYISCVKMFLYIQRFILPRPSPRRKRPFHAQKTLSSRT